MARTLTAALKALISWVHTDDTSGISTLNDTSKAEYTRTIGSGVSSDQADLIFYKTGTIAGGAGSPLDIDLTAAAITYFGDSASLNMVEIIAILIENLEASENSNRLKVGAAAANPIAGLFDNTNDIILIPAGGAFFWSAPLGGIAVANGSADVLRINTKDANSAAYRVTVLGRSS